MKYKRQINDVLELAIRIATNSGKSYIYERREKREERDIVRKVYILSNYPSMPQYLGPEWRVDGDYNEHIIATRITSWKEEELKQPALEDLLKKESRVQVRIVENSLDYSPDCPNANYSTHKLYELTPIQKRTAEEVDKPLQLEGGRKQNGR